MKAPSSSDSLLMWNRGRRWGDVPKSQRLSLSDSCKQRNGSICWTELRNTSLAKTSMRYKHIFYQQTKEPSNARVCSYSCGGNCKRQKFSQRLRTMGASFPRTRRVGKSSTHLPFLLCLLSAAHLNNFVVSDEINSDNSGNGDDGTGDNGNREMRPVHIRALVSAALLISLYLAALYVHFRPSHDDSRNDSNAESNPFGFAIPLRDDDDEEDDDNNSNENGSNFGDDEDPSLPPADNKALQNDDTGTFSNVNPMRDEADYHRDIESGELLRKGDTTGKAPPSPGRTSVNARLFGNILEEHEPSPQKNSQSTDAEGEGDLLEKANERYAEKDYKGHDWIVASKGREFASRSSVRGIAFIAEAIEDGEFDEIEFDNLWGKYTKDIGSGVPTGMIDKDGFGGLWDEFDALFTDSEDEDEDKDAQSTEQNRNETSNENSNGGADNGIGNDHKSSELKNAEEGKIDGKNEVFIDVDSGNDGTDEKSEEFPTQASTLTVSSKTSTANSSTALSSESSGSSAFIGEVEKQREQQNGTQAEQSSTTSNEVSTKAATTIQKRARGMIERHQFFIRVEEDFKEHENYFASIMQAAVRGAKVRRETAEKRARKKKSEAQQGVSNADEALSVGYREGSEVCNPMRDEVPGSPSGEKKKGVDTKDISEGNTEGSLDKTFPAATSLSVADVGIVDVLGIVESGEDEVDKGVGDLIEKAGKETALQSSEISSIDRLKHGTAVYNTLRNRSGTSNTDGGSTEVGSSSTSAAMGSRDGGSTDKRTYGKERAGRGGGKSRVAAKRGRGSGKRVQL